MPITLVTVGAGGGASGTTGLSEENPVTINMSNANGIINLGSYSTVSFRIKNPAEITLSNGTNGVWYKFVILSDSVYSFTSEVIFPYNNTPPLVSDNTRIDLYSIQCVVTDTEMKYLATYAFDYSTLNI